MRSGSVLLFSCINEAYYRGCKKDLTRNNESADGVVGLSETIRCFNEAFQFGMPNDVVGFLEPLGWDASADGAVKDVKSVYKVRTPSALQGCLFRYHMKMGPRGADQKIMFQIRDTCRQTGK